MNTTQGLGVGAGLFLLHNGWDFDCRIAHKRPDNLFMKVEGLSKTAVDKNKLLLFV